jgi:cytochrome c peroxidase
MKISVTILLIGSILLVAFKNEKKSLFSKPNNFPAPTYDFTKNKLSKNKIELGRALFYDPILSENNAISCASCHLQYTAFAHVDHRLSHGIYDRIGNRNAPALINLAWQKLLMWDGAVNHLDVQPLAPIHNSAEMNENISDVVKKLQQSKIYPPLFYQSFGDSIITGEHTLKAIAQFMLTIVSANSKYDKVKRNETQFTAQEKKGYELFKQHCNSCHQEPLFTTNNFANNGLKIDTALNDVGRFKITQNNYDSLKFKIPTLRNIEFSYPYMHDGRFKNLNEVLKHYTSEIEKSKTLAEELKQPIVLSSNQKIDLIAFLLTLTDKEFLFDKKYSYPTKILNKN